MKTLYLNLKKKWFDMILSGEKKEEYREIKPTIVRLLFNVPKHYTLSEFTEQLKSNHSDPLLWQYVKPFDNNRFLNGMKKLTPQFIIEHKGISIGKAKPEWSDNWQGEVFIIKLGNIIK